jgi:polysaccharide deacetylase 2 family uncharacterized protein YibQ
MKILPNGFSKKTTRRGFLQKTISWMIGSLAWGCYFPSRSPAARSASPPQDSPAGQIALIIDDIGATRHGADPFLQIPLPLTFSILPHLKHSGTDAAAIHEEGHEIMLHQPMEPHGKTHHPGPGALYVGDNTEKIKQAIKENIGVIPHAKGVNNHMGSRFTEQTREIKDALQQIQKQGLYFIDSYTSSASNAYKLAKQLKMARGYRSVFLDNVPAKTAILSQLQKLEKQALTHGRAIGIGHPYPETAAAIHIFSKHHSTAVRFVYATEVLYT